MLHWAPRTSERGSLATASRGAHAAGLRIEVSDRLDDLEDVWQRFEAQSVSTPFQSWPWLAGWAQRKGNETERPVVALGYEQDVLKIILPLAIERRYGLSSLVWLGQEVSDYNGPLIDPGLLHRLTVRDAEDILRTVAAIAGGADSVRLEKQPKAIDGLPNPFAALSASDFTCSAHSAHLAGDWETFYRQRRSGKRVKRQRQRLSGLGKIGEVTFEEILDPGERRTVTDRLLEWKVLQLDARGDRNPFRESGLGAFLKDCSNSPQSSKLIRIHTLKVGGELAAGTIGIARGSHYIYFVTSYDAARFGRHSPGSVLLERLIQAIHAEGFSLFDFSNGDEAYKDEWCDESMGLTVTLLPLTLAGRAGIAAKAVRLRAIREIKSRPRLFEAIRGVLGRLRGLRAERPAPTS
ncbi:MAG: GNAT family N-acetyltransferase [Parvibaculaceae bacterium]